MHVSGRGGHVLSPLVRKGGYTSHCFSMIAVLFSLHRTQSGVGEYLCIGCPPAYLFSPAYGAWVRGLQIYVMFQFI